MINAGTVTFAVTAVWTPA